MFFDSIIHPMNFVVSRFAEHNPKSFVAKQFVHTAVAR